MSGPNATLAGQLVGALLAGGVRDAVLAPGSRHTPIVLALAASGARLHTILDERSAGFYALGLARVTGRPVLVCCTSGSAGGHLVPAVMEADRSRLPLVVITADRPPELQRCGAPQTVAQRDLLRPWVRFAADPGAPDPAAGDRWPASLAALALDRATGATPGPVHLNLPFRKPLWDGEPAAPSRTLKVRRSQSRLDAAHLDALADDLAGVRRGLVVCGPGDLAAPGAPLAERHAALRTAVTALADALGWPVLADGASPLRHASGAPVVSAADPLLRCAGFAAAMSPDRILRIGQAPTASTVARWCAEQGLGRTTLVDPSGELHDPDHVADELLIADPTALARDLAERLRSRPTEASPSWRATWLDADRHAHEALAAADLGDEVWGGAVARAAVAGLPDGALLHVASSMAIRDLDAFGGSRSAPLVVTANRGTNGIDGTLSTALGAAAAWRDGPVCVVTGDLAFLHDVGALVTAERPGASPAAPVRVVVVDNDGGGIFDHLPIRHHPTAFEGHYVTPQGADVEPLCRGAGVPCHRFDDPHALEAWLARPASLPLTVAHVPIDRADDLRRHERAWEAVARALDPATPAANPPAPPLHSPSAR